MSTGFLLPKWESEIGLLGELLSKTARGIYFLVVFKFLNLNKFIPRFIWNICEAADWSHSRVHLVAVKENRMSLSVRETRSQPPVGYHDQQVVRALM